MEFEKMTNDQAIVTAAACLVMPAVIREQNDLNRASVSPTDAADLAVDYGVALVARLEAEFRKPKIQVASPPESTETIPVPIASPTAPDAVSPGEPIDASFQAVPDGETPDQRVYREAMAVPCSFQVGQRVNHEVNGPGTVRKIDGVGITGFPVWVQHDSMMTEEYYTRDGRLYRHEDPSLMPAPAEQAPA